MKHERELIVLPVPACPDIEQVEDRANARRRYHRFTAEVAEIGGDKILCITVIDGTGKAQYRFFHTPKQYGMQVFKSEAYSWRKTREPGKMYEGSVENIYASYIIVAFDLNNDLHGENAHRATSIHGHEHISALLEKLGKDATILVRDENKLDQMLPGNQILKSLELLAKVELVEDNVAQPEEEVKGLSLPTIEDYIAERDNTPEPMGLSLPTVESDSYEAWIKNQLKAGKQLQIYDIEKAESFLDEFGYLAERPENFRFGDIVTEVHSKVKGLSLPTIEDYIAERDNTPEPMGLSLPTVESDNSERYSIDGLYGGEWRLRNRSNT